MKILKHNGKLLSSGGKIVSTPPKIKTGYGALYNWYAVNNGLAPTGLKVPTDAEWTTLTDFLGGESIAGGKLKAVGTEHWTSPNADATDTVGFRALPGGYRINYGSFYSIGYNGYWWSATEDNATSAWNRYMDFNYSNVSRYNYDKELGFSVRMLVTDTTTYPAGSKYTDLDGNVYDVIQIGTQHWLRQNWACTRYGDESPIPNVTDETEWSSLTTGAYCWYDNNILYK